MRTVVLVLALLGLSACADAIVSGGFNSNAAVPSSSSSSTATVHVVSSNGAAAVAGALAFAALVDAANPDYMDARPSPSFSGPNGWFWARPVPELDPDRRISEQDCTKPLDLSQGNIRCK